MDERSEPGVRKIEREKKLVTRRLAVRDDGSTRRSHRGSAKLKRPMSTE